MRLKASFVVRAGIIPGQPMEEYTKSFHYTSEAREEDVKNSSNFAHHGTYSKLRAEAMDYFMQVSMPNINNWAELTTIWY